MALLLLRARGGGSIVGGGRDAVVLLGLSGSGKTALLSRLRRDGGRGAGGGPLHGTAPSKKMLFRSALQEDAAFAVYVEQQHAIASSFISEVNVPFIVRDALQNAPDTVTSLTVGKGFVNVAI